MKKVFIIILSVIFILAIIPPLAMLGYTYLESDDNIFNQKSDYNISETLDNLAAQAKIIVVQKNLIGSWVGDYIISDEDNEYSFEELGFQSTLVFDEDGTVKYRLLKDGVSELESGKWTMQDEDTILLELEDSGTMKVILKNDKLRVSYQPPSDKIKTMVYKKGELRKPNPPKEAEQKVKREAYLSFINSYSDRIDFYYCYDVDNNGVPDILLCKQANNGDAIYQVYTMKNDKVVKMGSFNIGYVETLDSAALYGNNASKGLLYVDVSGGEIIDPENPEPVYETIYKITYNGSFNKSVISQKEINPNNYAYSNPPNSIHLEYYHR